MQIAEINEKELLLTEMMEISEQIELWKHHVCQKISEIATKKDHLKDLPNFQLKEISIVINTKGFNTIVFGLMENFRLLQEVVLKKKVTTIISNSSTVRKLFYESPHTLVRSVARKGSYSSETSELEESD